MATSSYTLSEPRRSKQLRLLLAVGTLVALIEGLRSVGHFAVRDQWYALTYAILKLILVIAVWRKTNAATITEGSTLALKVSIIACLVSFLADAAFLGH
jgi:hypothetical protein